MTLVEEAKEDDKSPRTPMRSRAPMPMVEEETPAEIESAFQRDSVMPSEKGAPPSRGPLGVPSRAGGNPLPASGVSQMWQQRSGSLSTLSSRSLRGINLEQIGPSIAVLTGLMTSAVGVFVGAGCRGGTLY